MFRVEYMLRYVDHIPVTMDWSTREEAVKEIQRISTYSDLVYLQFKEL